eukprot:1816750-Pyramimonas_sp.AAC.1
MLASPPSPVPDTERGARLRRFVTPLPTTLLPAPVRDAKLGPPDRELVAPGVVLTTPASVRGAIRGALLRRL